MPFFLKSCLKIRKKRKQGNIKDVIQPISDITTHVTNEDIWKQGRARSIPSITTTLTEGVKINPAVQHHSEHDHLSINGNASSDSNGSKSDNESAGFSLSKGLVESNVVCYMAITENQNSEDTPSCDYLPPTGEISSPIINKEIIENDDKVFAKIHKVTSNSDIVPSQDESTESNFYTKESREIINKVTSNSNVFDIIERITEIESVASLQNHSNLDAKSVESIEKEEENEISDSVGEIGDVTNKIHGSETSTEKGNLETSCESVPIQNEINIKRDFFDKARREVESLLVIYNTGLQTFGDSADPEVDTKDKFNYLGAESEEGKHDTSSTSGDSQWTEISEMSVFSSTESLNANESGIPTKQSTLETTETNVKQKYEDCKIFGNSKLSSGDANSENKFYKSDCQDIPMQGFSDLKQADPTSEMDIAFNSTCDSYSHNSIPPEISNSRRNSGDVQNPSLVEDQKRAISYLTEFGDGGTLDASQVVNSDSTHNEIEYQSEELKITAGEYNNTSLVDSKCKCKADEKDLENHSLPISEQGNDLPSDYHEDRMRVEYYEPFVEENIILEMKNLPNEYLETVEKYTLRHLDEEGVTVYSNEESKVQCSVQGGMEDELRGIKSNHDYGSNHLNSPMDNDAPTNMVESTDNVTNDKISRQGTQKHLCKSSEDEINTNNKCIENEGGVNFKENCRILNETNIDLDGQYQNLKLQDTMNFCKFGKHSDSEESNNCVDEHEDEYVDTFPDIYCSDDTAEYQKSSTESEGGRNDCRNLCQASQENSGERETSLWVEPLRCEEKNYKWSCFSDKISINNRKDTNYSDADTVDMITSQSRWDVFWPNGNNALKYENMIQDFIRTRCNAQMPSRNASYDMSDNVHGLANDESFDTRMRKLLRKENAKTREKRAGKSKNRKNGYKEPVTKCNVVSHSGSSELSDSGDNIKVKESKNFLMPAGDDKNIDDDRMYLEDKRHKTSYINAKDNARCKSAGNIVQLDSNKVTKTENGNTLRIRIRRNYPPKRRGSSILDKNKTYALPDGNIFVLNNDGRFKMSPIRKNMCGNLKTDADRILKQAHSLQRIPSIEGARKLDNVLKENDEDKIEIIRMQSIKRFQKKKMRALSEMGPDLRNIALEEIDRNVCTMEDICLAKQSRMLSMKHELNKRQNNLSDYSSFPRKLKESTNANLVLSKIFRDIDHQTSSSESDVKSCFSVASEKMTPARRRILIATRAIRSPKQPYKFRKKSSQTSVLYRRRQVKIKPPKVKLLAYLTKDEQNNVQLKTGYRVHNPDPHKIKKMPSEDNKCQTTYFTRHPPQQATTNRAMSPIDLQAKFDDSFKKYASRGRPNGNLMSYKRSTEWLRDAGVIGKKLSIEEANDAFKCTAGVKIALNKGDYRNFLRKLTRVKKLNYNEVYGRLCSASHECAEKNDA